VFHLTAALRDRSNAVERSLEDGCQAETCRIENKRFKNIVPHWFYSLIPADVSTKAIAAISVCIGTVECRTTYVHFILQMLRLSALSCHLHTFYLYIEIKHL